MIRQLPVIPTMLVLAAAGVMVYLGFWQLGRADEKAAMIAEHSAALEEAEVVEIGYGQPGLDYRTVRMDCQFPYGWEAVAGRNTNGQSGFAHRYRCTTSMTLPPDGPQATVVDVGWSRSPVDPGYTGGQVEGVMVTTSVWKIVASEPIAGLQPLAKPDPNDLPNNHLAYAGQWFFFALTALVIYGFAVQSRLKRRRD